MFGQARRDNHGWFVLVTNLSPCSGLRVHLWPVDGQAGGVAASERVVEVTMKMVQLPSGPTPPQVCVFLPCSWVLSVQFWALRLLNTSRGCADGTRRNARAGLTYGSAAVEPQRAQGIPILDGHGCSFAGMWVLILQFEVWCQVSLTPTC